MFSIIDAKWILFVSFSDPVKFMGEKGYFLTEYTVFKRNIVG